jgi:phosphomannomutase/phosphoglucomutase
LTASLPESLFRAYDIRGIYEDTLTCAHAERIGQAIGEAAVEQGASPVAVGRDGRLSGPDLSAALARGIQTAGADVVDIGVVPTPALYFATHEWPGVRSGVMVTGSHNPPEYNGFKIVINGTTLSGEAIQDLKSRAERGALAEQPGSTEQADVLPAYLDAVVSRHPAPCAMKVVVDCGNGVAGVTVPEALERLGHDVVRLYTEVDGTFPNHHPDPGDIDSLTDLTAAIDAHDADIGLAFDGDGDRLGVVLPGGDVIYPDIYLMALAEDLAARQPGARILFDVKCTGELFPVIEQAGGIPEMGRTGHSLIKARMKESGALLAGEMSGHIFFAENWYGFDDALVAAARLLNVVGRHEGTPTAFFARYPRTATTPEIPITVTEENKMAIVQYLQDQADLGQGERRVIDGIRMDYPDGWGLCRASNTSPKLVTRYEARDEEVLSRIRARFEQAIDEAIRLVG